MVSSGDPRWLALSQQALLAYATRGDSEIALSLLRRQLAATGREAVIGWTAPDGSRHWVDAQTPGVDATLAAVWAGAPAQRSSEGWWWLPLDHLSARVGVLGLSGPAADDDGAEFEPLVQAAAALAASCARPDSAAQASDNALLRAALHGAGTYVWEWRPDSDELTDVDEGLRMLGYTTSEVAPTQEGWNRLIHPDDLGDNHAAYLRHARGETEQYEHVYRARAADGRWHWLHERGRIVERALDGSPRRMLGTQSDITTQRELEAQAQTARERLALIARHVPGMLYQFVLGADRTGSFVYVSERCQALFGVSPEEATSVVDVLFRRIHLDWRERVSSGVISAALKGTQWRDEFPVRRRDGVDRWMLGAASPRAHADGSFSLFGYIADVTDLRELEAASRDKAAAEAASRAKTEFLSRMSHELRTPLNAVLGFAQLLELAQAPPLAEAHRRPVLLIRQAGEHLLTMIGDLLDLTRIESGQLALHIEPVTLAPLFEECIALVQAQAAATPVSLVAAPLGALALRADRTRLKQVLLNLLSNAVKYNRPGGAVTLRAATRDGAVRIEVSDTGLGIAPEHLARVFEPFQRGGQHGSSIEGTGIGLAVCKSLVELMGGRIEVQSTQGKGSLFVVELALA